MAENPDKTAAPAAEGAAPPEGAEAAPAPAAGRKKLLMLGSAALAVVGVLVAVGVVFFMGDEKPEDASATAASGLAPAVFDVPQFTVNLLADEAGVGPRFLKITLALELEKAEDSAAATALLPRLQDDWGGYLRQLRPIDIQGSAAQQRLREGLLRRATQTLAPIGVKAVFVRDMLAQ